MKVGELIERLQKFDPDGTVYIFDISGDDCDDEWSEARGIERRPDGVGVW